MVKVRFFGHSNVLLEHESHKILMDPFFSGNPLAPVDAKEVEAQWILVTHGHSDHLGDTIDIAKRCNATVIAPFEIAVYCTEQGLNAHGMHIGGKKEFPFGMVRLTPALHGSGLYTANGLVNGGNPGGFLLHVGGKSIYHAGDTGLFRDMELINTCYLKGKPLDLALLPIGDNFTMGPDDALFAVKWLRPKQVIPMHYNTFPVIEQDPQAFKKTVEESTDSLCAILEPGQSLEIV